MKSDIIKIDNHGNGFEKVVEQTGRTAKFRDLGRKEALQLQLCAEEMLSLVNSIAGEVDASFWIESTEKEFDLHMSTRIAMDKEKRHLLLSSATSRKNEAAGTFLGKLLDTIDEALLENASHNTDIPDEAMADLVNRDIESDEWDRYEQSVLQSAADHVRMKIRGNMVEMVVSKNIG